MELTAYQQEMLDGVWGKGKSMAMQVLVGIGKCFDAPRLVPITRAHVSLSAQEADLWFSGKLLAAGASCAVPPTVNPGYSLDYFGGQISEAAVENMRQVDRTYRQLGARMTYSCTPIWAITSQNSGKLWLFPRPMPPFSSTPCWEPAPTVRARPAPCAPR